MIVEMMKIIEGDIIGEDTEILEETHIENIITTEIEDINFLFENIKILLIINLSLFLNIEK